MKYEQPTKTCDTSDRKSLCIFSTWLPCNKDRKRFPFKVLTQHFGPSCDNTNFDGQQSILGESLSFSLSEIFIDVGGTVANKYSFRKLCLERMLTQTPSFHF